MLAVMRLTIAARDRRRAENWGCGRTLQTARMEYTATSFAEPLQRVFDDVLQPDLDIDVTHADESRYYERPSGSTPGSTTASKTTSTSRCFVRTGRGVSGRGRSRTAACTATSRTGSCALVVGCWSPR